MRNMLIKIAKIFMITISTLFLINAIIGLWYMHISVYYEFNHMSWKIWTCCATGTGIWGAIVLYVRSVRDYIS